MEILTSAGRSVSVQLPAQAGLDLMADLPAYSVGGGQVRLIPGPGNASRSASYAQIYRANPWVFAAVNARAGIASRIPIHVMRPDDAADALPGERVRVRVSDGGPGDGLARLLASPRPRLSARRFRRQLLGDLLVHGNALSEHVYSGSFIAGMQWQPWQDVKPDLSDDGLEVLSFSVPVARRRSALGFRMLAERRPIDATACVHLTLSDDTELPLGVSPLAPLHATHALHDAALRFAVAYMENGVFPSGMVEAPSGTTPEQLTATRRLIEQLYTGPERAGQPFVAVGKWHQIMASPEGSRLVELAKLSREEVGGAYRVPMSVLGDTRDTNKATATADLLRFVRYVVGEDIAVLESELQAQLVDTFEALVVEGLVLESQMAEMLRPDPVELSLLIEKEVGGPIATANEGRKWVGLPRLRNDPDADRLQLKPGTPDGAADDPDVDDEDDE